MAAEFLHLGIPVTEMRPNMTYREGLKAWISTDPEAYEYRTEFLKFEEGSPMPQIAQERTHVAYRVDDLDPYMADADEILYGPVPGSACKRFVYMLKDGAVIELCESF